MLSAHFIVSAVENPQNAPPIISLPKRHASNDVKLKELHGPALHLTPVTFIHLPSVPVILLQLLVFLITFEPTYQIYYKIIR